LQPLVPTQLAPGRKVPPHTRARESVLAAALGTRHIPKPMSGSPRKRQRKSGIRADNGSVIAFRYMTRVAELPPGWRHRSPAEKVEHLLGKTLDGMAKIMWWPIAELDPFRLSVRMQVLRIVFAIGVKAYPCSAVGASTM